jgi:hypothetical protein
MNAQTAAVHGLLYILPDRIITQTQRRAAIRTPLHTKVSPDDSITLGHSFLRGIRLGLIHGRQAPQLSQLLDVVCQGGTVAALRRFVVNHGGVVVAVVALAFAIGSTAVAPARRFWLRLMVKFGMTLTSLLQFYGIAVSILHLTNSQIRYLLRFASVGNIERKLIKNC